MAWPGCAKLTVEESALENCMENVLSLSLRAPWLEARRQRGGEGARSGGLLLGSAILRDKLRQMGSPPRAKSSSVSEHPEAESLSCKSLHESVLMVSCGRSRVLQYLHTWVWQFRSVHAYTGCAAHDMGLEGGGEGDWAFQ